MSEICSSALNPSTKQVACTKIPNLPAALIFCDKGEKFEVVNGSIEASVLANAPIVMTGIKTAVPVDTAATSQTLGDYAFINDDEYAGLTFGFVKTPCNVKAIRNVATSGKGGVFILSKNGVLIGKEVSFDGANYYIEPLDINTMAGAFPTGILADGSDLAATLTVNFGYAVNIINSAKIACSDIADDYAQIIGYDLTIGAVTATTVEIIATDCAGGELTDVVVGDFLVNGTAPTAVAYAEVGGHGVHTLTMAVDIIFSGTNSVVMSSTEVYGKATFKYSV